MAIYFLFLNSELLQELSAAGEVTHAYVGGAQGRQGLPRLLSVSRKKRTCNVCARPRDKDNGGSLCESFIRQTITASRTIRRRNPVKTLAQRGGFCHNYFAVKLNVWPCWSSSLHVPRFRIVENRSHPRKQRRRRTLSWVGVLFTESLL